MAAKVMAYGVFTLYPDMTRNCDIQNSQEPSLSGLRPSKSSGGGSLALRCGRWELKGYGDGPELLGSAEADSLGAMRRWS